LIQINDVTDTMTLFPPDYWISGSAVPRLQEATMNTIACPERATDPWRPIGPPDCPIATHPRDTIAPADPPRFAGIATVAWANGPTSLPATVPA
jgi:hypothetical protein